MRKKYRAGFKSTGRMIGWFLMGSVLISLTGCAEEQAVFVARAEQQEAEALETPETEKTEDPEEVQVFVCGEVVLPGVYPLQTGERIARAVELAGGFTEEAATEAVNLAEIPRDGQMIRIPSQEEWKQACEDNQWGAEAGGKLSLNRATEKQLMALPGIGESRARAIVAYREEHGGFRAIDEIKNISGIKEGLFLKIKDQITVE